MNLSLPILPARKPDSHKGDFGRALLIGGSRGMSGAISLSGMSALRGGAGLVTLAVPDSIADIVATFEPSYMTIPLPNTEGHLALEAKDRIHELATRATCIGCGPGLGQSEDVRDLVHGMYAELECPIVFDADALNVLAKDSRSLEKPGGPRVLTPHPGEFKRLVQEDALTREQYEQRAADLAARHRIVILLKGNRTFITDGIRSTHNQTGNSSMSTGGTGDVLTGLITALICQGLGAFEAAQLGAHVHGRAGDLAAAEIGPVGMIASDLLGYIPRALQGEE